MKRISPIRARSTDTPHLLELKNSLRSTREALNHAYAAFDYASDPELTEACIFEIQALQARTNYLVREIKAMEACAATAVAAAGRRARWI